MTINRRLAVGNNSRLVSRGEGRDKPDPRGNQMLRGIPSGRCTANASQARFLSWTTSGRLTLSHYSRPLTPSALVPKPPSPPGVMSLQTQSRPATGHDATPTKIPEGGPGDRNGLGLGRKVSLPWASCHSPDTLHRNISKRPNRIEITIL